MTHRSTWKSNERKVAAKFGTKRTPLSGGNSGHTRSDTLHPDLFIEVKYRKNQAVQNLYDRTAELARKENKTPVLVLQTKGRHGFLIVVHSDDLNAFRRICKDLVYGSPKQGKQR